MSILAKEINDFKKGRKRFMEIAEEWRNKERYWEIRIRMLEDKIEEIGKEVKEKMEARVEKGRKKESETGSYIGEIKMSRRASSCGGSMYTDMSEDRFSTREVGKLK